MTIYVQLNLKQNPLYFVEVKFKPFGTTSVTSTRTIHNIRLSRQSADPPPSSHTECINTSFDNEEDMCQMFVAWAYFTSAGSASGCRIRPYELLNRHQQPRHPGPAPNAQSRSASLRATFSIRSNWLSSSRAGSNDRAKSLEKLVCERAMQQHSTTVVLGWALLKWLTIHTVSMQGHSIRNTPERNKQLKQSRASSRLSTREVLFWVH